MNDAEFVLLGLRCVFFCLFGFFYLQMFFSVSLISGGKKNTVKGVVPVFLQTRAP